MHASSATWRRGDDEFEDGDLVEVVTDFYEDQPQRNLKHHVGVVVPRTTETTVWVHPPGNGVAVALHGVDPMVLPTAALRRLSPQKQPLALGGDVRCRDGPLLLTLLHGRGLPKELAQYALRFLYVRRVAMEEVSVRAVSSDRGDFPLSELLSPRDDTWWISTPKTQFEHEWVDLATSTDGLPRRVTGVKIKIPPLPYGPLSAKTFDVCYTGAESGWKMCYGVLRAETLDRAELQEFALLGGVDATTIRIRVFSMAAPRQTSCGIFQLALF
jgi:hypothetical protein